MGGANIIPIKMLFVWIEEELAADSKKARYVFALQIGRNFLMRIASTRHTDKEVSGLCMLLWQDCIYP